ncbi:MAG: HAD hydrolase family protein [Rhodospirillales bacterium]|nr:HAD hydrolase family protein [Rhodospirillales bacterium]
MTVVAIVPAIAAANLALARPFAGRPLLAQTVAQARLCPSISAVVVVTDDAALARIAEAAGARVMAFGGDVAGAGGERDQNAFADRAAARAVDILAAEAGEGPDLCVILDPSRPLRTPEMIESALDHLARRGGDSLLSVHESFETLWAEDAGGFGLLADEAVHASGSGARGSRPRLAENRVLVITRAAGLREWGKPLTGRIVLHCIPRSGALQLRGDEDWCAGEALYRRLHAGRTAARLAAIRLLVFDFDGVMTDNRVVVFEDGREGVLCSRGDGMGLDLVRASGLAVAVISKEGNPVVSARCRKLKIPCIQGIGDKLPVLRGLCAEQGIELQAVAYMGNDINDRECMEAVGLAIAPADAEAQILRIAGLVTTAPGGLGAVREVTDLIVAARRGG